MTKRMTPQPKKVKTSHKPQIRHNPIIQENLYTGILKKCKPNEVKTSMDQEHCTNQVLESDHNKIFTGLTSIYKECVVVNRLKAKKKNPL